MIITSDIDKFRKELESLDIPEKGALVREEWESKILYVKEEIDREFFLEELKKLSEKYGPNFYIRYFSPDVDICWKFGVGFIDGDKVNQSGEYVVLSKGEYKVEVIKKDGFYRYVRLMGGQNG